jgi:hypothetical protein
MAKKVRPSLHWRKVRKHSWAWEHVAITVAGKADIVTCRRCRDSQPLVNEYRSRAQIGLEFARVHYYRCVVPSTALPENTASPAEVVTESPLFDKDLSLYEATA